jgi:hypothetical protein
VGVTRVGPPPRILDRTADVELLEDLPTDGDAQPVTVGVRER